MFLDLRVWCGVSSLAALLASASAATAQGRPDQGRLDARFTISVAGISVGQALWKLDVGTDRYTVSATGGASSWLKVLVSGRGEATAQGPVQSGIPLPAAYTARMVSDDETAEVTMTFEGRDVKDLSVAASQPDRDRIPLTDADRKDVMDPLTALIVPIGGPGDVTNVGAQLGGEVCKSRLPIFDGRRRFDLRLSFKRIERVRTERGYQGPVVVCAMTYHPVSGHRPSSTLTKYLSEGRDMELWLAPVAGTHLAAPYRLTIANIIGSMTISATQWDTVSTATERTTPSQATAPRRAPGQ